MKTAKSGGESSWSSSVSVHNELLRLGRSDLVQALAGDWWVDRKVRVQTLTVLHICSAVLVRCEVRPTDTRAKGRCMPLVPEDTAMCQLLLLACQEELHCEVFDWLPNASCLAAQGEIPDGKLPYFRLPIFNYHEGYLSTSYNATYYELAQRHQEVPRLTDLQREAIRYFNALARVSWTLDLCTCVHL